MIGFMSENIYRNLNVFRPFYSSMYQGNLYTKPRFSIENGHLSLWKNPLTTVDDYRRFVTNDEAVLREIGSKDYFYQAGYFAGPMDRLPSVRLLKVATRSVKERLNPVVTREGSYAVSSEAFTLAAKLFDEFHCAALQHAVRTQCLKHRSNRSLVKWRREDGVLLQAARRLFGARAWHF